MMKRTMWMWIGAWSFIALVLWGGCSPKSRYEYRLEKELSSGVRHDSIFMGMHFGMTDKDFYTLCWELNLEGIIKQSMNNTSVEYRPGDKLKHAATMTFYPKFAEGKIVEMPVRFSYDGWAPWNEELSSYALTKDIKNWYEDVYGRGFIKVTHPVKGIAFTKTDGNRRITIYQEDELYAWAIFTDLTATEDDSGDEVPGENSTAKGLSDHEEAAD